MYTYVFVSVYIIRHTKVICDKAVIKRWKFVNFEFTRGRFYIPGLGHFQILM
jgi:hypothetical protein